MAMEVIGAGLGRTATFSLKFALEKLGFGPCYHMSEVLADGRRAVPLWLDAIKGNPDWDAIFDGFRSTTDYPACSYWRELAAHYPNAKFVLTTRDPDSWFDSVNETIFSEQMLSSTADSPFDALLQGVALRHFEGKLRDRAFMTAYFEARNQQLVDTLPPERLLTFHPKQGWEPLCAFLGVPVPDCTFPRVNSRDEINAQSDDHDGMPADPAERETFARAYIKQLKAKAFS